MQQAILAQRQFFESGTTRPIDFRIQALKTLFKMLKGHESELLSALNLDLGKPRSEAYISEIGYLYKDIQNAIKHVKCWAKKQKVSTPLVAFRARSYILPEPKGVVLIMAPWNYPLQLLIAPLVGAIAAGNCAVLKPSELAPSTSGHLRKLISQYFPKNYIHVIEGDASVAGHLLELKFDHIFFTGSEPVGKKVIAAAAMNLTPVTLELGGKSPCIVDESANLYVSAKRIVWGKFFNAGQTCVAPDYLLVNDKIYNKFTELLKREIQFDLRPDYGKIVNAKHFERLKSFLKDGKILSGGQYDAKNLYIEPTLLCDVREDSSVMNEEIFGPILPILRYSSREDVTKILRRYSHPLALYVFSCDKSFTDWIIQTFPFGGGCVNDTLLHLVNDRLPFGGIGTSGMGAYHGKFSFDTFSHFKSILQKTFFPDFSMRYRPYREGLLRRFF